jgi:predicted dehydrogenase
VDEAQSAYEMLLEESSSPLGLVLTYDDAPPAQPAPERIARPRPPRAVPVAGVIGAGSFSQRVLIPAIQGAGFALELVASANGLSARSAADRFGFSGAVTPDELLASDLDLVCIASRHGSHASYAIRALEHDLPVFVEKPPALSHEELDGLRAAAAGHVLQVGFNRRFAPLAIAMRDHIADRGAPIELLYRVAAGRLPDDHWLNDPQEGGGRLLGEGCHFVDFACWLVGDLPSRVVANAADGSGQLSLAQRFAITLAFADGSLATILYGSESAPGVGKELVEVHSAERSAVLHDYRRLELHAARQTRILRDRGQDKGHRAQFVALRRALEGERPGGPDPLDTMGVTLDALSSAGQVVT